MLGHVDMGYKIYKPSRSGNLNFYNLDRDVDELVINKGSGNIGIGNLPDINLPQKKLSVGGDVLITDDLTVDRNVIIGENIQIDGTMLIKDTSTFKKDVSMETNLELDGILTVNNTSTFVNDITLNTNMSVQNNLTVDNILTTKQLKLTEDNLILPTVKSGHVLIANGTNYRGKALGGVIAINSEGETSFVNGQLLNIHIKDGEITNVKYEIKLISASKPKKEGTKDVVVGGVSHDDLKEVPKEQKGKKRQVRFSSVQSNEPTAPAPAESQPAQAQPTPPADATQNRRKNVLIQKWFESQNHMFQQKLNQTIDNSNLYFV